MSHRSRRILGLVLKTKESHSDHTSARLSECVKQDTCDIPMFQKISQENIENINPCDTEVAHVVAETASSQKVENVTQYQSVSQTKLNLVPNYDSEGISNEDKPQVSKNLRHQSCSSSNSSSSSSYSSSSDSDSSVSSEITNEQAYIYSQPQNDIAITTTPVLELEVTVNNTTKNDGTFHVYDNSVRERRLCTRDDPIIISPRYTDESDLDDDIEDPTYNFEDKFANFSGHINKNYLLPSRSNSDTDSTDQHVKAGRKRRKRPENWRQNRMKIKRNKGQSYKSMSKTQKIFPARCLKLPCSNCRLNCSQKINDSVRYVIFDNFWKLGDLSQQRSFINSCMIDIQPKYKYTNAENPRRPNKAFFFIVNGNKVRVCKTFFKSTLDITDRMIHTIRINTNENGFLMEERRGKHGHNKKIDPELLVDIKKHIESIPRMESHYIRSNTNREYIEGGKTIKDLYKDFVKIQNDNGKEAGNYITYYKIFNTAFNLSFFCPKKDQCDLCVSYENANSSQKLLIEDKYQTHLKEKELSRKEKLNDRIKADAVNKVVVYDLEAVLQCPRGETSAFYYKSKLNSYNLTLTELNNKDNRNAYNNVYCYFWTEVDGKRGAIEIGSCVWDYLNKISSEEGTAEKNIIFYSDNCCGQNKNKFIATLYLYALQKLNINSITHKFLIRGHTQNEADSVHSLIEKEIKKNLKSGPIYTPDQYIALIKSAKKSNPPINVYEMTFDSFINIKDLQDDWGYNFHTNIAGETVNWNEIKQLSMFKGNPFKFYYKNSYEDQSYKEVDVRNKRKKMKHENEVQLKQAYTEKQSLSANKKKDLKELLTKGLIPSYYANFYNTLL